MGTSGVVNWVDCEVWLALNRATVDKNYPFIPVLSPLRNSKGKHEMDIQPIRTDEDYRAALAEIEACWVRPKPPKRVTSSRFWSLSLGCTKQNVGR